MNMENSAAKSHLDRITQNLKLDFEQKNNILSFEDFVGEFYKRPRKLSRTAPQYILDLIHHYGVETISLADGTETKRLKLFERPRGKGKSAIVGQDEAHSQLYKVISQFVRQGRADKLILLHGPNGSSKSSTAEALGLAMEDYSRTSEGAVYMFHWIFPNDKIAADGLEPDLKSKKIGFGDFQPGKDRSRSFAHLNEAEILCKLTSEIRENPIYLLPPQERVTLFQNATQSDTKEESLDDSMKHSLFNGALSSKNKRILDALLVAYQGDFEKVLKHVQVERFYFSSRYKTGISTVEPQVAMDAHEKQITMERNYQNLPPALQNIRFYESFGELIDANRGFIEYSDLLKRPIEAYKYLLTTTEKMSITIPSGTIDLDLLMLASTNEKHLDAFKAAADWQSFKGRFELIRVPYLLSSSLEQKIYGEDLKIIQNSKPVAPHTLDLLSKWVVLTRLRQPDPEFFESNLKPLISRLDPYDKLSLYDGLDLSNQFNETESSLLRKNLVEIRKESQASVAYEGRFGASPREAKMLLYFASQNSKYDSVCAPAIFEELENLTRDRSVYDYLQFEPRNKYHDFIDFLKHIKQNYAQRFHKEFLKSLNLFDENQYLQAFDSYLKQIVAFLNKERIFNEITGKTEDPSETVMQEIENLMGFSGNTRDIRERILNKVANWKLENKSKTVIISDVFSQELNNISRRIYESKKDLIDRVQNHMLTLGSEDYSAKSNELLDQAERTYSNLNSMYGYTKKTAWQSLIFSRIYWN
jgi:serine protein kinase